MIGLALDLATARPAPSPGPAFHADFTTHTYVRNGQSISPETAYSFARTSPALMADAQGTWQAFAPNALRRIDELGALIEPAATNVVPDTADLSSWSANGVSVSLPGAAIVRLNNDSQQANARITRENIAVPGLEIVRSVLVKADGAAKVSIHSTQFQSSSAPWKRVVLDFETHAAASAGSMGAPLLYGAIPYPQGWFRLWFSSTTTEDAATLGFTIRITDSATDPLDAGVLIRWPQLETGTAPTTPIATAASPATRAAEQLTLHLPPGSHTLTETFSDASTRTTPAVSGDYLVPPTPTGKYLRTLTANA